MSYTPSYNRPPKGNFNKDKAFSQVRAGTDAYLLEDEANEMQAIQSEKTRDLWRRMFTNGVVDGLMMLPDPRFPNTFYLEPFEVIVDGYKVKIAGFNNRGTPRDLSQEAPEDNFIRFGDKPVSGMRTDLLLLEVYEEEVRAGEVLYKYGLQNGDLTLPNDLIDDRIGAETSRRMQVKTVLRLVEDSGAHDWQKDLTGSPLTQIEPSLYRSAAGRLVYVLIEAFRISDPEEYLYENMTLPVISGIRRENFGSGSLDSRMLQSGAVTTQHLLAGAVDTTRLKDAAVSTAKLADGAVTNAKLGSGAVSADKIGALAVTTAKIGEGAVTAAKIADGNVTFDKLAPEALKSLYFSQGFAVPHDQSGQNGIIPILRFFRWWLTTGSATTVKPIDDWDPAQGHSAKVWGARALNNKDYNANNTLLEPWDYFDGVQYMSQIRGRWFDKNLQVIMSGAGNMADNVSILCMHNVANETRDFNPGYYYSSAGTANAMATASIAYKVFNPNEVGVLDGLKPEDFTEIVPQTTNSHGANPTVPMFPVPSGHAVLLVLKTSPVAINTSGIYYNNHHGFYNFNVAYMAQHFKPHMPTYRRMLSGKW